MARRRWITLSTDFGSVYASQVKAVLHRRAPHATVVELASDLPTHRIAEAAFLLRHMASGFPRGTVHLAVVDPGVGGRRAPIAVACADGSVAVGPDNGLLEPLVTFLGVRDVRRIDPSRIPDLGPISPTFEGRDLFAPAAAVIAAGKSVAELGVRTRLSAAPLSAPHRRAGGASGEVVHVDRFGNAITNIPGSWLPRGVRSVELSVSRRRPVRLPVGRTYEDLAAGGAGVLVSSFGTLEVSGRDAPADQRFRIFVGSRVRLGWLVGRSGGKDRK